MLSRLGINSYSAKDAILIANGGVAATAQTGELAGTTGVDTEFTISASETYDRVYIENRTGIARNYSYTLFNLQDGITVSAITAV